MTVGQRLKEIRTRRGYTQKHLSELTGIHEVLIARYESGNRNPKTAQLQKLADALEVNINLLEEPKLPSNMDVMFALFDLEKRYGEVSFEQKGPNIYVNFDDRALNEMLFEWMQKKEELSAEDYEDWKMNYPEVMKRKNGKMVPIEKGNK